MVTGVTMMMYVYNTVALVHYQKPKLIQNQVKFDIDII
jgi:hypothetical protein